MNHRSLVLNEDSEFKFHCHDGLDCFKECCRDINIFLTPYDVLRMKNSLGISSGEFLERYTLKVRVPNTGFSIVQIKMSEENDRKCPFITPKGCQVYSERPWSCRLAPVDMLGEGKYSFIFESSRCHGLMETKAQTVKEWVRDQGLIIYEDMEQGFSEIPSNLKLTGNVVTDEMLINLFFMACYDLDKFRDFLMSNLYLFKEMDLDEEIVDKIKYDDVQLMKFGFNLLSLGTDSLKDLVNS
ncbi:YkgJ family cysteine cluster protein [Desulfosporosinus sp.]|uniref:YkgJ family cysteine cluster protein n=1 Tax=Desulfosporosinus sp. TaxID=157907 RepID=UPI0025BB5C0D|nr:YkgJ family cysteine cluster protein [Desulfosporosinus sp.]MBC2722988.1 YkgJ family cysteine cluster protein [Desulfosporosinus sp.]MBC2729079.1 YkgJ family cysteine cluster protein [Desulfosporosinus sp.]